MEKKQTKNTKKADDKSINGLGDVVKAVTNALGIETCEACEERRKKWNQMFPFTKSAKSLEENEIAFLKRVRFLNTIGNEDRLYIFSLYNRVFNQQVQPCQCPTLIIDMRDKLWNVYIANHSQNINES